LTWLPASEYKHRDTNTGSGCRDKKSAAFSRRRAHNPDAAVDYINSRNAVFNKKLERAYGGVTKEIKANLERGTALPE
jgi:pre-mRNA-splicing factor SYF2